MFCPHCGKEIAEEQTFCQFCGARLIESSEAAKEARSRTPWEERREIGFFTGLLKTVKETLLAPSVFFRKMPVTGGLTDPILYALIIGMIGLMVFYFWDIVLRDPMQNFMSPELRAASEHNLLRTRTGTFTAILTPFLLLFWLFIVSGVQHVLLLMVRGAQAGFEATFRVVSYSVSPFILLIIPLCGMPITSIWIMVLTIIGLKEAHEISGNKAAFAVLFPFLLCCGVFILAIAVFMSAVAASLGTMFQQYR